MMVLLGSGGMLGSMVAKAWEGDLKTYNHAQLDAEYIFMEDLTEYDRVINCIGITKPYCDDVPRAIKINALFPHRLPTDTIQIATDCVFSGSKGAYIETDPHDALDVYGKTKSLGEASHLNNLRCSIVGPELKNHISLLDWFLSQTKANGYSNHFWNGITTYHYALIVQAIIKHKIELPIIQHIVPADVVSKAELLEIMARVYKRKIPITRIEAPETVDRSLRTNNPKLNKRLWRAAGYSSPPTVEHMLEELYAFTHNPRDPA